MGLALRGVTGKVIYWTQNEARTALDKVRVRRRGHKTEQRSYVCKHCANWHITCLSEAPRNATRLKPHTRLPTHRIRDEEE